MAHKLRVVDADERVEAPEYVSVLDAGERGGRLDELVQIRRILARSLDDPETPARDLSPLVNRYTAVSRDIETLKRQIEEEADHGAASDDEDWSAAAI